MTQAPDCRSEHFAIRKWANWLPDSSAANILRVQGAEKQACSMAHTSSKTSGVADSIMTESDAIFSALLHIAAYFRV